MKFLVVYDYGQGGIWAFVIAEAPDEVKSRYPELDVIERRPDWMTSEIEVGLDTYDLEDVPTGLLRDLLNQRSPA